jgi:predicted MFS family arabinose efflux permease
MAKTSSMTGGPSDTSPDSVPDEDKVPAASWYALALLTLTVFFAYMDRIALSILVQPIKADLGLSDGQFGLLSGIAFAALFSTLGIPLARLADRGIRVKLIAVCLVIWSIMTFASGLARNFSHLFLARVGVGIGEAGCVPASHSLIGDLFPKRKRALAVTIFQTGTALGVSGGLFIVGMLGERLGWRHTLQAIGLMGIPLAILIIATMPEPKTRTVRSETSESMFAALGTLLKRRTFMHVVIGFSLGSICTFGISQWLPAFLIRSFGMGMAEVGAWVGLTSATSGIVGLITGGLVVTRLMSRDQRWELWLPALAFLLVTPIYAVLFLSPYAWLAITLKFVSNFVGSIATGVALASVQSLVEEHRRATAIAIIMFLSALLGMGLGPALIGYFSDFFAPHFGKESLRYALLASCLLPFWASMHFFLAARSVQTRPSKMAA